jgi:hypothetical protein
VTAPGAGEPAAAGDLDQHAVGPAERHRRVRRADGQGERRVTDRGIDRGDRVDAEAAIDRVALDIAATDDEYHE